MKLFGREEVKVPRTRKGGFRSKLLPEKWRRNREVGEKLLRVLLSMGYTRGTAKIVLLELGLKTRNEETINTSPVDKSVAFIYLNGHRMKVRTDTME